MDIDNKKENEDTISLLDIILVFVKHIKMIILTPFISGVVILILLILSIYLPADSSFNFFPNKYKPKVTILLKTPGSTQGGFSSLLNNSEIGSLVGILGGDIGLGSSDLGALVEVLLKNNEIQNEITELFDFKKKYNISKYVKTNSRKILNEKIAVESDFSANTIIISFEDTDPVFATNVVNQVVAEVEKKLKKIYLEQTVKKRIFLEERLEDKEKEFKEMQDYIIRYQQENGIIDVALQAENSISLIAQIQSDIITQERQLKALEKHAPHDSAEIAIIKYNILLSKKAVEELKKGGTEYSNDIIPLDSLPGLTAEFLNLKQDLTIQAVILQMLKEQYEAVKIEESDKSQTFNVLQWAEVPEIKNSPRRSIILVVVVFVMFFLAIFVAFIKEYFVNIKNNPEEGKKLDFIKDLLHFYRKK